MTSRFPPGTIISGRYEIVSELGSGGWATVYQARQTVNGEAVALKTIRSEIASDDGYRRRFRREQKRLRLTDPTGPRHRNVCPVLDWGEDEDGTLWLVMALIDGVTLAELVSREGPLPPERAANLIAQAAAGLHAVHTEGNDKLVHRDVRPKNLMVTPDDRVLVIDFGIAKAYEHSPTDTPLQRAGEGTWSAPDEEARPSSDVYSLALVLAYVLTGREPEHRRPVFPPNIAVDKRLRRLIEQATLLDPRERPDAATFEQLVRAAVAPRGRRARRDKPPAPSPLPAPSTVTVTPPPAPDSLEPFVSSPTPPPPPPDPQPAQRSSRGRRIAALLVAALAAAAVGAGVAGTSGSSPQPETASAAPLSVTFAQPWERDEKTDRQVGAARLASAVSLAHRSAPLATLSFGRLGLDTPIRRLFGDARPHKALIGRHFGLRYSRLPADAGKAMSVFMIATTAGYATFACRARTESFRRSERLCNGLIARARIRGARVSRPSPNPAAASIFEDALARFGAVQDAYAGKLASTSTESRAAAARRIAKASGELTRKLRIGGEPIEDAARVERIAAASAALPESYRQLAKALDAEDRKAYGRIASALARKMERLRNAVAGLRASGYVVKHPQ